MGQTRTAQQHRRALKFAQCMRDNGVKDFPDPAPNGATHRYESDSVRSPAQWAECSPRRNAGVPRLCGGRRGGTVILKRRVLAGAAVLLAASATAAWPYVQRAAGDLGRGRPAGAEHRHSEKSAKLSAMVSEDGTLTYQAQADGSPYAVINQARGYTRGCQSSARSSLRVRCSTGSTTARWSCCMARRLPIGRWCRGARSRRGRTQRGSGLARLCHLGAAAPRPIRSGATAAAVEKLQAALGVVQDGALTLGQAVFEPAAVRVTTYRPTWWKGSGGPAGAAGHLDHSPGAGGARRLPADRVAVGDPVTISLPDDQTTPGVVSAVGTVATAHRAPGRGAGSSSRRRERKPAPQAAREAAHRPSKSSSPPLTRPPPVVGSGAGQVDHHRQRPSALVVPMTALLAQAGGGYAVEVVGAGEQPSRARLARPLRRRRRPGPGHRLGAGRRPARGGPGHMTRTPPPHLKSNAVPAGGFGSADAACRCSRSTT